MRQNLLQLSPNPSHRQPSSPSDDDSDILLDDNILDEPLHTNMASYDPNSDHFDGSQGFLPAGHHPTWQSIPATHEQVSYTPINHHNNFFTASSANHFQSHPEQHTGFSSNDAQWHQPTPLSPSSQSTPFGNYPSEPTIKPEEPYHHRIEAVPQHGLPPSSSTEHRQNAALATSPQSETGWMSASSSDHTEKAGKRENQVPFFIDNPPRLRPDGVRKKNARFEIPEDRKVDTIDKIIMATDPTDEGLLKELKQQKRLLRNRQAA